MYKGKKYRTAFGVKRTAFVMALCMMLGSLEIPVSAEEKSGDLHLLENADSGASKKNVPEGGNEAASGNNTEVKQPEEGGNTESSGDNTEDKKPEEDGNTESSGDNTEDKKPEEDGNTESSGDSTEDKKPEEDGNKESSGDNAEDKKPEAGGNKESSGDNAGDKKPEKDGNEESSGNAAEEKEPGEDGKGNAQGIVTGKDEKEKNTEVIEKDKKKPEKQAESGEEQKMPEIPEIINVVVPSAYTLALNPYQLPVRLGEGEETTEQIITGTYGIVNKSSSNQIVTVSFIVEDRTEGKLLFVDSPEEARNAGKDVYAIYLAAVPANEEPVLIDGLPVDSNVSGESLQSVGMTGASEQAVTLYAGANQIAFRLSAAIYDVESEEEQEHWVKLSGEKTESDAAQTEEEPEDGETVAGEKSKDDAAPSGNKPEDDTALPGERTGSDEALPEGEPESGKVQPEGDAEGDEVQPEGDAEGGEVQPEGDAEGGEAQPEGDAEGGEAQPEENVGGDAVSYGENADLSESGEILEAVLSGLDPDGKSVTAYTFYGVMNPDAEWEKLSGGIRLSVVYSYQEADGSEEIIEGTGAMIYVN